jgi:8-oxo-dGTP pyrophosphatase MutT (NUDIX family)
VPHSQMCRALRRSMKLSVDRLREAVSTPPRADGAPQVRRAAVAMIVDPHFNVLLMQRAERVGDPWSGHLSFPGGHVEDDDANDLAAAIRETEEEIGLILTQGQFLGALDPIQTQGRGVPRRTIASFLFAVPQLPTVHPNDEVAAVHTIGLAPLLHGAGRSHFTLDYAHQPWRLPQVHFSGGKLWGLTLQIVDDLLHRLDGKGTGLERPVETP